MGLRITGIDQIIAKLENVGDRTTRSARRELDKGAEAIRDLARLQAPVDEGNLEEAIDIKKERTGPHGRKVVYVYVDEDHEAGNKTVGAYYIQMHEGIGWSSLGPKSIAKQLANPGIMVGRKYLERAVDRLEPIIHRRIADAVKKEL